MPVLAKKVIWSVRYLVVKHCSCIGLHSVIKLQLYEINKRGFVIENVDKLCIELNGLIRRHAYFDIRF